MTERKTEPIYGQHTGKRVGTRYTTDAPTREQLTSMAEADEIERLRWFEERYHLKCKVIAKQDDEIERLNNQIRCADEANKKLAVEIDENVLVWAKYTDKQRAEIERLRAALQGVIDRDPRSIEASYIRTALAGRKE